jgi:serine/threonine protein kinase
MISNQHCKLYCMPHNVQVPNLLSSSLSSSMQVYIEDASGNGTLINQTTLLRKGERRLLHSGDEICLVNTETLRKKIRSARVLQPLLQQYSYVFVRANNHNLHQLQHPNSNSNSNSMPPPFAPGTATATTTTAAAKLSVSTARKGIVNPRAMKYLSSHSSPLVVQSPPNATATAAIPKATTTLQQQQQARHIEADYDIREILGDGTSGQVRRAIHRHSGAERAVKIIPLRKQRGNLLLDPTQILQEAQILQRLDHPYIVQLLDVYVRKGIAIYLVMEWLQGGDLFDRIVEKQSYSQVQARRTMRRLTSAIHYLHQELNIVHRDLKPENILLKSKGGECDWDVQLTDFGLAKSLEGEGLKTFCGTPQYFAPEVLERRHTVAGQGRYGKPADMWSLGVILYILLSGRPPFPEDDMSKLEFPAVPWATFHPAAQSLVVELLRRDPRERLTIVGACSHPWILQEDGDSHVHPLEDPVVTTRKRLFVDEDDNNNNNNMGGINGNKAITKPPPSCHPKETDTPPPTNASSNPQPATTTTIIATNAARSPPPPTKPVDDAPIATSTAAPRKESLFQVAVSKLNEPRETVDNPTEKNVADDDSMDKANSSRTTTNASKSNPADKEELEKAVVALSTSPKQTQDIIVDSSVTPSELGLDDDDGKDTASPRRPLSPLSMNQRSNRFRELVLVQTCETNETDNDAKESGGDDEKEDVDKELPSVSAVEDDDPTMSMTTSMSQSLPTSPNVTNNNGSSSSVGRRPAVTPTASNVAKKKQKETFSNQQVQDESGGLELMEDAILSQFSTATDSIGSFESMSSSTGGGASSSPGAVAAAAVAKSSASNRKRPCPSDDDDGAGEQAATTTASSSSQKRPTKAPKTIETKPRQARDIRDYFPQRPPLNK